MKTDQDGCIFGNRFRNYRQLLIELPLSCKTSAGILRDKQDGHGENKEGQR